MQAIPDEYDVQVDDIEVPRSRRVPGTTVVASARATAKASVGARHLLGTRTSESWSWQQLRDYVLAQAEETHGQLINRDPLTEKGIFDGFVRRFGDDAPRIARYAFEQSPRPGYWLGAPIRPGRFTKAADEVFAREILAKLDS